MEVSSYAKKMLFTLLEGWESLGSVAHAACGAHWQRLLGMPGVRELQRRKIQEKAVKQWLQLPGDASSAGNCE